MPQAPLFDAQALIAQFESASARQGEQLRRATSQALLTALQGRELTLKNMRQAMQSVADAASAGAARNALASADPTVLLEKAAAGIDDALLKAVEANRKALATLQTQGADLREKHLAKALADLDKLEDTMITALQKTADGAAAPLVGAWAQVLGKMQAGGTLAGNQAAQTAEQFAAQMQATLRSSRAAGLRAAQAMAEGYATLVSGVLIGMQEGLQPGAAPAVKRGGKAA